VPEVSSSRCWQPICGAASVLTTDVAVDVAIQALRYGGGSALFLDNMLQRCWRDVLAAGQHFGVSDVAYEAHGRFKLGMSENAPGAGTR